MTKYTRLSLESVPLSSRHDEESEFLEQDDDYAPPSRTAGTVTLPSYLLWTSVILVCLNTLVALLVPYTPFRSPSAYSISELDKLPFPNQHLSMDRAAAAVKPLSRYHYTWPTKIVRLSQKLKNAVFGDGVQVFISVEDTTIMQFPIQNFGVNTCALLTWTPLPELSPRKNDLQTKGDVSEIEVWSIIAPHRSVERQAQTSSTEEIEYNSLSWDTRPVRGELLGTLDLTARPNATTVEFMCPTDADTLVVEFRCLRVACYVRFKQLHMSPKIGFELVQRHSQ